MRKLIIIAAVLLVAAGPQTPDPAPAPPSNAPPPIVLSPAIPGDANVTATTVSVEAFQPDFDVYSWNTFIALNWPPGKDGNGDPKKIIGKTGDNDTVWENYRDVVDVFLPGGAKPAWKGATEVPAECKKLYKPGMRVMSQVGKTPTVLTDFSQPFNTGPIIDQNGIYTRFEILINKPMFDYIVANSLYSKVGQKAFTPPVKFTCGSLGSGGKPGVEGAIMVKSGWKVINASEKPRFHTEDVLVYSPASKNPTYPATCTMKTVGMVGLHIAHKTQHASQWLWSTFEHVDNAPTDQAVKSGKLKAKYNYYNPKCYAATCPPNQIPPRPWDPTKVSKFHSQVVRMNLFNLPIYADSAAARNADAHKLLLSVSRKSVWANYELISTMWPTNPGNCGAAPGDPLGTPAPTFLANTTLETYLQRVPPQPNASSQCIECHLNATMTVPVASDFTYILQRAK
ncbi:MAG: cytochrome C [Acidobacteriota bacterium]